MASKTCHRRIYTSCLNLNEVQREAKLISRNGNQTVCCLRIEAVWIFSAKGQEGTFYDNGYVLYFDWSNGLSRYTYL